MSITDTYIRALAAHAIVVRADNTVEQPPFTDFKDYLFERTYAELKAAKKDTTEKDAVRDAMNKTLERLTLSAETYALENDGQKQEIRYPF